MSGRTKEVVGSGGNDVGSGDGGERGKMMEVMVEVGEDGD